MRCPRCGNENPDGNRFCGMCGGTLVAPEVTAAQVQRAAASGTSTSAPPPPVRPRIPEPAPRPTPMSEDRPSISGPSFLGLNDPSPRKRNSGLSIDPQSSSRNLDYLLDDEEPPRGSGAGKIFLILLALALAVGLGYLRWKGHGFAWLTSGSNKPSAIAKTPDTGEPDSSAPSNTAPSSQTPAANQPAPADNTTPAASTDATNSAPATQPGGTSPKPTPKAENAAPSAGSDQSTADNAESASSDSTDSDTAAEKPAPAQPPAPKPQPAAKPARPAVDPVTEAQKYLYGRGVSQDCERGLRLLKPAANAANPKAMVQMGALYSAGLCTPHDLPTSYRWFAMALRKDPENQAIQSDLQKLWGEMTQPERQLAIKLTQ